MNTFSNKMRERSNFELLKITTTQRSNYQEAAVEAAELEMKARNLSPEDIHSASSLIEAENREKERQEAKTLRQRFLNRLKDDPTHRPLMAIIIILSLLYIINLLGTWSFVSSTLQHPEYWDWSTLELFSRLVLIPIGIFGLYKVQTFGWVVISFMLGFFAFTGCFNMVWSFEFDTYTLVNSFERSISVIKTLDPFSWMVFATRFTFLFSLPIALGSAIFLYYLNRPEMLSRFDVNKTVKNATLLLATLVSLVLAMLVYFPF